MRRRSRPRPRQTYLTVKQVAEYLQLNEKKIYALVQEGRIPATRATGKWLFPKQLVDDWLIETAHGGALSDRLVIGGSDDPLLAYAIGLLAGELGADGDRRLLPRRHPARPGAVVEAARPGRGDSLGPGGRCAARPLAPDRGLRRSRGMDHRADRAARPGRDSAPRPGRRIDRAGLARPALAAPPGRRRFADCSSTACCAMPA